MNRQTGKQPATTCITAADLQERLEKLLRPVKHKCVFVALRTGGQTHYAALSSEADVSIDPTTWLIPPGCIAKLFTGSLIDQEIRARRLSLQQSAIMLLHGVRNAEVIARTTLLDLHNHTHGLDGSAIAAAPLNAGGFIDTARLLDSLSACRLSAPGEIYSYSNAGAWILGAILEQLNGIAYQQQLRHNLFEPLGITASWQQQVGPSESVGPVCAATGRSLTVSVADLMRFLEFTALGHPEDFTDPPRGDLTVLPGWNLLERGVYRGWKWYGAGWFGHNSLMSEGSMLVRVQPQSGMAIVLFSGMQPAASIATRLLPGIFGEYRNLTFPSPLSRDAAERIDARQYCGQYRSATTTFTVTAGRGSELRLGAPTFEIGLVPAADEVFLTHPANAELPYVQFLRRAGDTFRFLWDGRKVYLRDGRS